MKLIIAEKKSVGETIAKVLGVKTTRNGYLEGDDYIISWCQGHLVGRALPDSYGRVKKNAIKRHEKWQKKIEKQLDEKEKEKEETA